jgi:predicted RNA binding protein YcfA (HicA-like mRNA interferase family)
MAGSWCDRGAAIVKLRHATKPGTITVAGKLSIEVPPGTLNMILKLAGLKK